MNFITSQEAALRWGITTRRIQQMCKNGEIEGVKKEGKFWIIPEDTECPTNVTDKVVNTQKGKKKKPLPIGISDFKKATSDYYYVDKTLLIRDFIDAKPQVSLFTRPRRFGKTLTMDMLRVFFEKTDEDTSKYFKDKAIWGCGDYYTAYQGQYPVVFLTFKDVKCATWEDTYDKISKLIALEFLRHGELETSSKLNAYEKEQYINLSRGKANEVDYQMSLQVLSLLLYKHYGKECVVIIDEYDTPIQQGHTCGFYEQIIDFMRSFFSGGLKDNTYLAYGFLTGILRVAKESIFSGLNNLKINSILDEAYSQFFGFTKDEVKKMLEYYGVEDKYQEVCDWYDGYLFGNTEIFNPWSVINYISDKCFPKAFWQSTGSNDIIGEIIASATPEITENLTKLLMGKKVTTYIDTSVIYPEVINNPYSVYSFLLIAGYLKVDMTYPQNDGNYMCDVAIPNKEIAFVYGKEVLSRMGGTSTAVAIQQAIFKKDVKGLEKVIKQFMLTSISYFDGAKEAFYHGMMMGLLAAVNNEYHVVSNDETGHGRLDAALLPKTNDLPGFIFEFKKASSEGELEKKAEEALSQIDTNKYDTMFKEQGITNIIKIGIAFFGKQATVKSL